LLQTGNIIKVEHAIAAPVPSSRFVKCTFAIVFWLFF